MEARFAQVHLSISVANPVIVPSEQTCMGFFFVCKYPFFSSSNLLLAALFEMNSLWILNLHRPCRLALLKKEFPSRARLQQSCEIKAAILDLLEIIWTR